MSRRVRPLRDRDDAERAFRLKAATWSLAGALIGAGIGVFLADRGDGPALLYILGCAAAGWAVPFVGALLLAEGAGRAGASIYFAGGGGVNRAPREYSLADALRAQGRYEDAAAELARRAAEHADDPQPRLRLARLYRDELQRPGDALAWFRQASAVSGSDAGADLLATRELLELCHRLHEPQRALPDLARLAERRAGTAAAEWARREMQGLKAALFRRDEP